MTLGTGSATAAPDLAGRTLGGYRVDQCIGRGGGGTVYRATSERDGPAGAAGTVVALKVFHPELLKDEQVFRRFQREAELGMKIRHPNVVATFETGVAEVEGAAHHFIAMELVEGETLRDMLAELGTLPEELLYSVGDQFLDALSAVHAEGMIHRDVKPENIVLTRRHELKLMDLGVARLQQQGRDLTRAGEFVGSLAYAAPEQFVDQDHVGPRADIYAFGVLLYEMATGVNPYDIADIASLLTRKLRGQARRPKAVQRDLDPFLDEVIQCCLQADPEARFAGCAELRAILRDREESAWWRDRTQGEEYPAAIRALKRLRPPRDAALVGRTDALASLHAAFERAVEGRFTVATVRGPAGIGKSRLAHDFAEELVSPEGPCLFAGRAAAEVRHTHHAFRDAWSAFLGAPAPEDDFVPALTDALRERTRNRPVLFVLEDLQHADAESLALLEHLGRALAGERILFLLTARDDEIDDGGPAADAVAPRDGGADIELAPLDRDAGDALLGGLLGNARSVRALSWAAFRATDGNPGFLVDVVAHLRETGVLTRGEEGLDVTHPVREIDLPRDARDLVAIRVGELDDELRALLDAAAVLGPEFESSLLADLAGEKRIRLLKKLALLERRHRLLQSAGKNAFRFASFGLQRVLYDAIDPDRRREIHARCAEILAEDGDLVGERAQLYVRHLLRAERLAQAGDAVDAAMRHAALHDHGAEAVQFIEEIVDALGDAQHRQRFDAWMLLARLHGPLGHLDDERRALAKAAAEAGATGDPAARARVQAAFAAASSRAGSLDRAEEEATQALLLAGKAKAPSCEAQCLHLLGVIAARRGDPDRAAGFLRDALALRRELGDRPGEAATLARLGALMPELGEAEEALETKRAALEIVREIGDRRGEGAALNNLGNALVDADRIEEALASYEESVRIARAFGDLPAEAAALHNVARVQAIEGRIDESKETFGRALDIFRQLGDPSGEAEVLDELGSAVATFGDRQAAIESLEAAREAALRHGEFPLLARVLRHLGSLRHEEGEKEEGWRHFERALGLSRHSTRSAILADMGAAAEREGDFERATELLQESLKGAEGRRRTILSLCRLARAHQRAGRSTDARECARRAEEVLDRAGGVAPHYGPEVYYSLGTVLAGDNRAPGYLRRANELLGQRTRAIRSVIYRDHYLTMRWPNREIIEESRRLMGE